jgi:hypothetical protein
MNAKELDSLLEKYYSGSSTEEEERSLKEYFSGQSILPGYEAEKEIFRYYKNLMEIPEPSPDFETRILEGIEASGKTWNSINFRRYLLPLIGTAASILILAGSYFFFNGKGELKDTYNDPNVAYLETRKILLGVSAKMNHVTLALEPVSKMNSMTTKSFSAINKSTGIIEKNLKMLDQVPFDEIISTGSLRQAQ